MKEGLILFAHGARDPRWAEPFVRLRDRVAARSPRGEPISLAFLEHMSPDLPTAVGDLARQGADAIRVVPLFFGRGGHLREDFPRAIAAARAVEPRVRIAVTAAAGEDDAVLDALARFALEAPADPV